MSRLFRFLENLLGVRRAEIRSTTCGSSTMSEVERWFEAAHKLVEAEMTPESRALRDAINHEMFCVDEDCPCLKGAAIVFPHPHDEHE